MADTSSKEGSSSDSASERRGVVEDLSSVVGHDEQLCMKP